MTDGFSATFVYYQKFMRSTNSKITTTTHENNSKILHAQAAAKFIYLVQKSTTLIYHYLPNSFN